MCRSVVLFLQIVQVNGPNVFMMKKVHIYIVQLTTKATKNTKKLCIEEQMSVKV